MVDLHSHILYGVDDGARDLEESRKMLAQAAKLGYTKIVSTRHWPNIQFNTDGKTLNIFQRVEMLRGEGEKVEVEILRGVEVMISPETLEEIVSGQVDTIGESRSVLIEFQMGCIEKSGIESVRRIVEAGYTPLIAHVERYGWKRETLAELKRKGAVLQMNMRAAALGKKQWREWLTSGLIDILATDAHRVEGRSYELSEEIAALKRVLGEARFKLLTEINPERLLADKGLFCLQDDREGTKEKSVIKKILRLIWLRKK